MEFLRNTINTGGSPQSVTSENESDTRKLAASKLALVRSASAKLALLKLVPLRLQPLKLVPGSS